MENSITIILKPTDACNMRCKHCYHAVTNYTRNIMTIDTFKDFIYKLTNFYKQIMIIWHGGEPLLASYSFYIEAYRIIEKVSNERQVKIKCGIQTNGTLLNEKFLKLFKDTNTSISLSYDGPFNDRLRSQTKLVERQINLLQSHNIKINCISTISNLDYKNMLHLYTFFQEKEINFKFNPIIPMGEAIHNNLMISKEEWYLEYEKFFDYWFFDLNAKINVYTFRDVLKAYFSAKHSECTYSGCLFRFLSLDSYGNVYPCGRMSIKEFKLANIKDITDVREVFLSKSYINLLKQSMKRAESCENCKHFTRCHSGCNSSAYVEQNNVEKVNEFDCYFNYHIFDHVEKLLENLCIDSVNPFAKDILKCYK